MRSARKKQHTLCDSVSCVVLAGGKGTRLYPLTKKRAKPAVVFGGNYRLIDIPLSNALNAQIRSIYVISQYLASGIQNHILDTFHLDPYHGTKLTLLSPEETDEEHEWYLGTADAVRKNLATILESDPEYVLILSGDQLYNMDLAHYLEFAKSSGADLCIATLPVSEKEAHRMGIMSVDSNFRLCEFIEKPSTKEALSPFQISTQANPSLRKFAGTYLASMGIYIFKKAALQALLQEDPREDFGKHIIPTQLKKGSVSAYLYEGYWEDIGTIASYYDANMALTENALGLNLYDEQYPIYFHTYSLPSPRIAHALIDKSIICQGAIIENATVRNSIIGIRAHIGSGSLIENSLILGTRPSSPAEVFHSIGENCVFKRVIIDENVSIGKNVQLINKSGLTEYDGEGIFVRDGIIIVPSETTLPDGFIF